MVLGLNPGVFYLRAKPPALFFIFYFETGFTKLRRASLSSWGWLRTRILRSQPPKYWNYKCVPPRLSLTVLISNITDYTCFFCLTFLKLIYITECIISLFLFITKKYSLEQICNLFIHSVDRYLVFFHLFLWHWGCNPGAFYLRATPPAKFIFLFWNRVSLSCGGPH